MSAPQGSFEWYNDRIGRITMSQRAATVMDGHVHKLNNLLKTLWWERDLNEDQRRAEYEREARAGDTSPAMSWGRRHESEMLEFYEMTRNVEIIRVELQLHPVWPDLVADSADFIETDDGTLEGTPRWVGEIKCPYNDKNHLKTLRYGMPAYHHHQTQGHMECHGMAEGRFGSFDPRQRVESKKLYVQNLVVDPIWQKTFREKMTEFYDHWSHGTLYPITTFGKSTDGIPSMF